jgi:DNA mismatch repair protein PMS2
VILEENWPLLCQKHTTSKISCFEDLASVLTYGFRGEALSSLCAVSKTLVVTTRTHSMNCARKLHYDIGGNLIKTELVSRQVGTSISVTGLFHSLPVRKREFKSKLKQEICKMTALLSSFAIINVGVKISCFDSKR